MAVAVIAVLRNVFGLLGCAVERAVPAQSPPPWPDDFDWRCRTHGVIGPCSECEFDTPASVAGVGPAGERIPPTMPSAGRLADLVEMIADVLHDSRGMSANGQARLVAERVERSRLIETGHDIGISAASEFFPQHTKNP